MDECSTTPVFCTYSCATKAAMVVDLVDVDKRGKAEDSGPVKRIHLVETTIEDTGVACGLVDDRSQSEPTSKLSVQEFSDGPSRCRLQLNIRCNKSIEDTQSKTYQHGETAVLDFGFSLEKRDRCDCPKI